MTWVPCQTLDAEFISILVIFNLWSFNFTNSASGKFKTISPKKHIIKFNHDLMIVKENYKGKKTKQLNKNKKLGYL